MPEQGASWAVFMEDPLSLEQCAGRLERRGFRSFVVPGLREAAEVMRGLVREFRPSSASYGDSMTLKAAGILVTCAPIRTFSFMTALFRAWCGRRNGKSAARA